MQGPHLREADAVFSGHAHVYERLEVDGKPFFISGFGGRPPYPFRPEPLPESRLRISDREVGHGSLRVTVAGEGVLIEYLSHADGAGGTAGGRIFDQITLGGFARVANSGEHPLEVVAGQALEITTSTPDDGEVENLLDPMVELVGPGGAVVAAASDGAADGRNAFLTFTSTDPGRYRIRVFPEGGTAGHYQVAVTADPPLPATPIAVWRLQQFGPGAPDEVTADRADPDADGLDNLGEYVIGSDANDPSDPPGGRSVFDPVRAPALAVAEVVLRAGLRPDLVYTVEASAALGEPGAWAAVAERLPGNTWTGSVQVVENPLDGDAIALRMTDRTSGPLVPRARFFRLCGGGGFLGGGGGGGCWGGGGGGGPGPFGQSDGDSGRQTG
jgi:hypothetical protein